jgi:hypothetical protein
MNDQEETESIHKFVHLFPERRAISEVSQCKRIYLFRLLWGLLLLCMKQEVIRFCSGQILNKAKF